MLRRFEECIYRTQEAKVMFKELHASDVVVNKFDIGKKIILTNLSENIGLLTGKNRPMFLYDEVELQEKAVYDFAYHLFYKREEYFYTFGVEIDSNIVSDFPIENNDTIRIIKVSNTYFGEEIKKDSIQLTIGDYTVTDDSNGNLYVDNTLVGNVFYALGILVITYCNVETTLSDTLLNFTEFTLQFNSSLSLYETQIRCKVEVDELNNVTNPSVMNEDRSDYIDYYKSEEFRPFITTIGLYDENNQLVAIGKLSRPIQKPLNIPLTVVIKYDS